nr:hypothetical protein [uncultured Roseibium sp.]
MPRKPNYSFERSERVKLKAAKKAERLKAKTEKAEARKAGPQDAGEVESPAKSE